MAGDYFKKLQDPRWQKKRLEVMSDSDFCCVRCGDNSKQLHVHHKGYIKDREPWDYDNEQLVCLCEACHEDLHGSVDLLKLICTYGNYDGPCTRTDVAFLAAGCFGLDDEQIKWLFDGAAETKRAEAFIEIGRKILRADMDCCLGDTVES